MGAKDCRAGLDLLGNLYQRDRSPRLRRWSQAWLSLSRLGLRDVQPWRYLCITGHHLQGTPATIKPVQGGIMPSMRDVPTQERQNLAATEDSPNPRMTAIINAIETLARTGQFRRLFDDGDIRNYPDHSPSGFRACVDSGLLYQENDQLDLHFSPVCAQRRSGSLSRLSRMDDHQSD